MSSASLAIETGFKHRKRQVFQFANIEKVILLPLDGETESFYIVPKHGKEAFLGRLEHEKRFLQLLEEAGVTVEIPPERRKYDLL
ncbi:MAG: hypothetical protein JSS72_04945 [Armatimonadetes bacterium]|nr:hypothetical protein [Armatimonadota bacterium]